jgi:phage/plasmid-associated DNA primase
LCTTWAGNEEGKRYYTADEVLSLSRTTMAQKIKILQGRGGDGKSLLGRLRANLYGEGHRFVSPSVFFEPEEFRKQGGRLTALASY